MAKQDNDKKNEARLVEIASKPNPTKAELDYFDKNAVLPMSYYDKRTPQDGGDY